MPAPFPTAILRLFAIAAVLTARLPSTAIAQQAPSTQPTAATPALTAEAVQTKIDSLTASKDLDAAVRDQALDLYRTALAQLETSRTNSDAAASMRQSIETAPKTAATLRDELKSLQSAPTSQPENRTLAQAQDLLSATQVELSTLRSKLKTTDESLRTIALRPDAARKELTAEKQRLEELQKTRDSTVESTEPAVVADARATALAARIMAKSSQIEALEQELLSLPARQDLLTAERDLAAARASALDKRVSGLQQEVNELRAQEARRQQEEAERIRKELTGRNPTLAEYAAANAELSQTLIDLTGLVSQATRQLDDINDQVAHLNELKLSADDVLSIGSDEVLGIGTVGRDFGEILREIRQRLPQTARLRAEIATRERTIVDERLRRLRAVEQMRALDDLDAAAATLLNRPEDAPVEPQVASTLRDLMNSRRNTLSQTVEMFNQHINLLATMNADQREIRQVAADLALRLNEQLLWLPSAAPISRAWLNNIVAGSLWITSPVEWQDLGATLLARLGMSPVGSTLMLFVIAGLLLSRRVLRKRLKDIADSVGRVVSDSFLLTPRAFLISLLLALPWPLLLAYLGWLLVRDETGPSFIWAAGSGLLNAAVVLLILESIRQMCRAHGLFNVHFGWTERACRLLGRNLRWFIVLALIVAIIVAMTDASGNEAYRDGLGRLAFIIGSIGLTIFMHRVLHPRRGAAAEFLANGGALWKSRGLWFAVITGAPAGLAVFAAAGYYEPASQIQGRLFASVWVCLLGLIVYSFAMRWVVVAHRRLAVRRAKQKRDQAQTIAAAKQAAEASGEAMPQVLEVPEVDLSSVSEQTRTLLRAIVGGTVFFALWLVWSKLIPALGVLDTIKLPISRVVTTDQGEQLVPITLWAVTLCLMLLGLTVLATRNVPGVLEITVLQRFNINAGTRYAIAAVSRYVIIALGVVIAFAQIGVDWSKMQWIVAALGVGLGFGLQEIVANFVSGLIILFEQPVRVGDQVTVGDLMGTVSRIHIRATTIIDPDNREIIVPNKAIITDRVINWALSDPMTRLVVKVGIAYGSDTTLAHRVLLETVKAHPLILNSPPPTVFFLGFGESSLDFEVRVYVREIISRIPVLHELHMAIDRALRENKIEIPFPQRDLHVRSVDGVFQVANRPMPAPDDEGHRES